MLNIAGISKLLRFFFRIVGQLTMILFYLADDILLLTQLRLLSPNIVAKLSWVGMRNVLALAKNIYHLINSAMVIQRAQVVKEKLR